MIRADSELRFVKGVGPRRAAALEQAGLRCVEDLLYTLPFRYEDRRDFARVGELVPGQEERTLSVDVRQARLIRTRKRGFTIFEARVGDASGEIRAVWYNQPYLERVIRAGSRVVLYGKAAHNRYGRLVLDNPEYEFIHDDDVQGVHSGRIVPVYRKLADISPRQLRQILHHLLEQLDRASLPEVVPADVARRHDVPPRFGALREVHFPPPAASIAALQDGSTPAQRALAFEEAFLLQLALALRRHGLRDERRGIAYEVPDALRTKLARLLPFKLTGAQKRVLREIGTDLRAPHPMHRLLQGDVGSGKTVVALLTLLVAVDNGYQGALMAPTEILAEQHARNIRALLDSGAVSCDTVLLTGSLRAAKRRAALERIARGDPGLVIGTHALFEAGVTFGRLGLVVIDEQHRFGVAQRLALARKGHNPDLLVMTATPIPRSLSMTLYGDLDLSVIDELPPGRQPVTTVVRRERQRAQVYDGLREEIGAGRQAYVVVPLVEETAKSDLKAADAFTRHLGQEVLPTARVAMLHGRMKGPEKERVMAEFVAGRVDVLVATTVIEVGVDVPNASVMVVEHAERFGLSQLHQLRGRVGRGAQRSYCVLMVGSAGHGREAEERLAIMAETADGFRIAERDMQLRGPGALFGTQQHGLTDLQFMAEILRSPRLLDAAREEARRLVERQQGVPARRILDSLGPRWHRRLALGRTG